MKKLYCAFFLLLNCISWVYGVEINTAVEQPTIIKPYSINTYDAAFKNFYETHPTSRSADLNTRIITDSSYFLGKPYLLGALGEGPSAQFDKSPLYRTDAFDCMTFVSTVLAMVESTDLQQFHNHMMQIQYNDGKPSFLTRNHFVTVDWNIYNAKQGYFTDETARLFPKDYLIAKTLINRPGWFSRLTADNLKQFAALSPTQTSTLLSQLHDLSMHTSAVQSNLAYVPLTALFDKNGKPQMNQFDKIPSGSIIEIVRPNWKLSNLIGTDLTVSHMGLAIRINNVLFYREASSISNTVMDIPLAQYLTGYLQNSTVKGISIFKIKMVNH